MKDICIFEDANYAKLIPLVYLRPVYHLLCGMVNLQDKTTRYYPRAEIRLFCRDYLTDVLKEEQDYAVNKPYSPKTGKKVLFINGRALLSQPIPLEGEEEIGVKKDVVVYARLGAQKASLITPENALRPDFINQLKSQGIKTVEAQESLITYPWDLINNNAYQIKQDFQALCREPAINGWISKGVYLLNEKEVFIDKDTKVYPGVVLNAENGPIYIGKNVTILPQAVIEGPVFIGDGSLIKIGAKIYEGTTIGEVCKVGGEVEESIIHGYSNKQHYGFLGHAYLGMWVNLGAGTTNSDLKNNYSTVRVYIEGKWMDSSRVFVGLTMADHAKAGINSMFAAGTVVGVGANAFGGGFLPKYVPSFAWCEETGIVAYQLDKFIDTAKKAMARRHKQLSAVDTELIKQVFELTRTERETAEMSG